jgi:hypothetical protein
VLNCDKSGTGMMSCMMSLDKSGMMSRVMSYDTSGSNGTVKLNSMDRVEQEALL